MIKTSEFIEQYRKGKVPASTLIKMAAFKEELENKIKEQSFEKVAASSWMGALKSFGSPLVAAKKSPFAQAMLGGLVFGGSLMALHEIVKGIEGKVIDWSMDIKKPKLFSEMLTLHPELKEKEDRARVYYEALWHFSPTMAENPLSAGAYIKQALQYDHVAQGPLPASIQELTAIEKNKMQAQSAAKGDSTMTTILSPFSTAVKGLGGGK